MSNKILEGDIQIRRKKTCLVLLPDLLAALEFARARFPRLTDNLSYNVQVVEVTLDPFVYIIVMAPSPLSSGATTSVQVGEYARFPVCGE